MKSSKTVLLFCVVFALQNYFCYGQVNYSTESRILTRGPVDLKATEDKSKWLLAKKLMLSGTKLPKETPTPSNSYDPEVMPTGSVGSLAYWRFKVKSKPDNSSLLISLGSKTYWLQSYDSTDIVEGDDVVLIGPVMMLGPKPIKPEEPNGKSYRALKLVTKEDIERAALEAKAMPSETFSLSNGDKVTGRFVELSKRQVVIWTEDGTEVKHKVEDFTKESFDRIRQLMKIQSKKK